MTNWPQKLGNLILGPKIGGVLPDRVRRAIASQQRSSEILIAWTQLAVVLTFATLYAISPKADGSMSMLKPVPLALGAYLAFTLCRIIVCHKTRAPNWFLLLSTVMDMALLMVLIWSFHIVYEQEPGFYLKAPTLLYVFIFIALRALRFDVAFVVMAGIAAATGWLILLWIAVKAPGMSIRGNITRNYIEYMNSNQVLIGAEFDKIISILMVTLILAVAILRARRMLVRAAAEGAAARELSRFFAPEIAEAITSAHDSIRPGEGVLREAAILHCDIRGFTTLSTQSAPGDLIKILAEYQRRMVAAINTHGGSVDKFLGDGILASFGATSPSSTYAADALRAMSAMAQAAAEWAAERRALGLEPVRIGVTVATGPVVFGAVGDESRLEYTVIGDAVNMAAKLDKQCKIEKCLGLATGEALSLALAQGYVAPATIEARPSRTVDGVDDPVDLAVIEPLAGY